MTQIIKIVRSSRERKIKKKPICVRVTWDADIVKEVAPKPEDHVVIKYRDPNVLILIK